VARRSKGKPFLTIDCETDPFKEGRVPEPFLWGCYDGQTEEYETFPTAGELLGYLECWDGLVYAHNGGRFDFHYLRDFINSDDAIMVIAGRLAKFKIGNAEFRDSMNILVNPLRAFAKEEIDYAKLEKDVRKQHMEEIERYLRSDCINLWNTIKSYFDRYGRSLTQAGAAMRYWKKKYEYPFEPQTMIQAERCREFYYGGRVECFVTGHAKADFSIVDLNSAYPDAMREQHAISPHSHRLEHLPSEGLEQCFIKLNAVARGCFPVRVTEGCVQKLEFPNDDIPRDYSITGWELKAALELDLVKIMYIEEIREHTNTLDFTDYVTHFYDERQRAKAANDKAADVFAKLFLNSLYGKFAADPEKYNEYVICTDETYAGWVAQEYDELGPWGTRILLGRKLPESKHRYYNVATAASITGKVRSVLMRGIAATSWPMYVDTDCIFARSVENVPQGDRLGEWKLEAECSEYAIAGKKTYAARLTTPIVKDGKTIEWKTASKGVKLTPEQIIRVAQGEAIEYAPMVPTYSIHRASPEFINRVIRRTKTDLHFVN